MTEKLLTGTLSLNTTNQHVIQSQRNHDKLRFNIVDRCITILSFAIWCFVTWQSRPLELIGPRQANLVPIAYASSEGSGEPAHPRSLARTSTARSYKQWVKRNFRQKARFLAPLNGWACAVKICHDGILEDTNSLDAAQLLVEYCEENAAANMNFRFL